MSWIQDTFNKSLFTEDSYKSAIGNETTNGYAVLKIIPEYLRSGYESVDNLDFAIIGVIQNPLKYSIQAKWDEMGGISGLIPIVDKASPVYNYLNNAVNRAGFASMGEVYASRKIYKKSGYLGLSAQLKVVNWKDDGAPVNTVLVLSRLLLPDSRFGESVAQDITSGVTKINENIKPITDKVGEFASDTYNLIKDNDIVEGFVDGVKSAKEFIEDFIKSYDTLIDNYKRNTIDGLSDYFTLRSSPPTVRVEVGNYFSQNDMIITDATFEFSKEITRTGPLYVDINVDFSSRAIITDLNGIGFGSGVNKSNDRVLFTDKNGNQSFKEAFNTSNID